jgi:dolichol-phosphate mannosyltransferase
MGGQRSGTDALAPPPGEGGGAATASERAADASRKVSPPFSLVLPTYNETKNLPRLIPRLTSVLERTGAPFEIIVVDDDSPDGTWALAGEIALTDPRLRVIRRRGERGLATAVVAGWKAARGEILGVMDADLQYPPEGLPDLLEAIAEDAVDVVVASRYAPGARMGAWSLQREIVSRGAIMLAKLALPRALGRLRDPNSGYFLIRRRVIENVDLRPIGFKILIEVLARGRWRRVVELPHAYEGRREGKSKLGSRQTVEFLSHLARLAWDTRALKRA